MKDVIEHLKRTFNSHFLKVAQKHVPNTFLREEM